MAGNDKVVLGLIGGHNQGRLDGTHAIAGGAEIKTFCDIDQAMLDERTPEFAKLQGKAIGTTKDFRTVLDDKDIDGVIIAVPAHWPTIMGLNALAAGKDIYIEKPLTTNIHDGHLLHDAVPKSGRISQVGT